jgi:Fe-Mn family superoxide dismutase
MNRRDALKTTALLSAGLSLGLGASARAAEAIAPTFPFALPDLPYPADALAPFIDARTMEIHHGKHHRSYVDNLNKALEQGPEDLRRLPLEHLLKDLGRVPEPIRNAVRNHGGGHFNHTFFWATLKKNGGAKPAGPLAEAIARDFGGFDPFWAKFSETAAKVFGSGWAWLAVAGGRLSVIPTANQDTPIADGVVPLLGIDVWEHAYYLAYQNKRADYIAAFANVIDWETVGRRFAAAR